MLHANQGDPAGELWLWLGCGLLALGALAVAALGARSRTEDRSHFVLSFFICTVASCSYFAMASGQLDFNVGGGDFTAQLPRYIDWTITTPLLLLSVSIVALSSVRSPAEQRERTTLLASLLGADVLMILTGIFASLSATTAIKWTWYTVSCAFFLAVVYLQLEVLRRGRARSGADGPNLRLAATYGTALLGLWLLYPIVWALGQEGADVLASATETACFMVLDVLAKAAFGVGLALGMLKLASSVTHVDGRESIDAVSAELGSGEDHRRHAAGDAAGIVVAGAGLRDGDGRSGSVDPERSR